jgi:hypothetical protein
MDLHTERLGSAVSSVSLLSFVVFHFNAFNGARLLSVARGVAAALLLAAASPSPARALAHPLHTAVAELTTSPDGALTIRIRAFSDDFSAAVARATGTLVLSDYQVSDAAASRYVLDNVRLALNGRPVALQLVRQKRDGDVTWLELRATRVPSVSGATIVNRLLMDLHADQVNIVKAQYAGRSFTTLFSRGDGAKRLP